MIKSICMRNVATYAPDNDEKLNDCAKVNFIYGANGSGKSTISNFLQNTESPKYAECSIEWDTETNQELVVYNKSFRKKNFKENIAGVFTLGEATIEEKQELEELKTQKNELLKEYEKARGSLNKKKSEKEQCSEQFKKRIWQKILKDNEDDFRLAFSGFRSNKEKFTSEVLSRYSKELLTSETRTHLLFKANSLLTNRPEFCPKIVCDTTDIIAKINEIENSHIWTKMVVGNNDLPIAKLIDHLNNSDWVNAGRKYISEENNVCPFCQHETLTDDLKKQLDLFFSGEYDSDVQIINSYLLDYNALSDQIIEKYNSLKNDIEANGIGQINTELFSAILNELNALFKSNYSIMRSKSKEVSQKVEIKSSEEQLCSITEMINGANNAISAHNDVVKHYDEEKEKLINDIWTFLIFENQSIINDYLKDIKNFDAAIKGMTEKLNNLNKRIETLEDQIVEKNKTITSVQPTVDEINRSLKAYGFTNFKIAQSDTDENSYQIQRLDGTLATDTLSEGEETFITFLYYLQLAKGATDEKKVSSKRILVIDDPISSLDSTVLYIVSSMVKNILDDVRKSNCDVEQVFILTHNVFFHKEASFINSRTKTCNHYKYWIINKDYNVSKINSFGSENPIKTSYELLWKELKENTNASLVTTQNIMRRILENYFGILGELIDPTIVKSFESAEDQIICKSLISWINDGSHTIPDDFYIDSYTDSIDRYKQIFKRIFENMGHSAHYYMMMGNEDETTNT